MYTVRVATSGMLLIGHPWHPGLAWSNEAGGWVQSFDGNGRAGLKPCLFLDEDALEAFVNDNYLYPRVD